MASRIEKDWLVIDGRLEPIDHPGDGNDRSPAELVEAIVETFSQSGDLVFDPFAGLGSTLIAAQKLGRRSIGFEKNPLRAEWVAPHLHAPNRIINASIEQMDAHDLPAFDLVCTSPPYPTVRLEDDPWGMTYFDDMRSIFQRIGQRLSPRGRVVVEVSNILTEDGFRPLVGQFAALLGEVLQLEKSCGSTAPTGWRARVWATVRCWSAVHNRWHASQVLLFARS
jgi:DNA modification methylase